MVDEHGEYIIDNTIRQFDPGLPYPYVGTRRRRIETLARGRGGQEWDIVV